MCYKRPPMPDYGMEHCEEIKEIVWKAIRCRHRFDDTGIAALATMIRTYNRTPRGNTERDGFVRRQCEELITLLSQQAHQPYMQNDQHLERIDALKKELNVH